MRWNSPVDDGRVLPGHGSTAHNRLRQSYRMTGMDGQESPLYQGLPVLGRSTVIAARLLTLAPRMSDRDR